MADVTLGFDELETNDLPPVCMVCGARRDVEFVQRRFMWRPLLAPPGLVMMLMTKRVTVEIPLCPDHGGPRLFAHQRFTWWGLNTIAIDADRLTLGRVAEEFADALDRWRDKRERGDIDEPPPPRRRVQVGRGPGGGGTALKVLGILAAVLAAFVVLGVVGMFGAMAVGLLLLPKAVPPPAPPPPPIVGPAAVVEPKPEGVVVALLGAAPDAAGPAALPWAPLALSARNKTFHLLEDVELNQALTDLKSRNPNAVAAAAKKLARATPTVDRRRETADALTAATANPFPMARQAAAEGLAVWGTADDVPALARMLADPFPDVKTTAITALADLRDPKAAAVALLELDRETHDPNPNVARAAAKAVQMVKERLDLEEKHP